MFHWQATIMGPVSILVIYAILAKISLKPERDLAGMAANKTVPTTLGY